MHRKVALDYTYTEMKKKRTFILFELFLSIGLTALFSLPLVHAQAFYFKRQKKELIELEKERKAEELFFKICSTLTNHHPLRNISAEWRYNPFPFDEEIEIDLKDLGKERFFAHYHLYSNSPTESSCRKLYCQIIFSDTRACQGRNCLVRRNSNQSEYCFIITVEKAS